MKPSLGAVQTVTSASKLTFVFLAFALLFISLRSNGIFAVDGAYRFPDVFHRQSLSSYKNNHLPYPANAPAWTRLRSALGFRMDGPIEYFSNVEIMNCLAASGSLTIIFILMDLVSRS